MSPQKRGQEFRIRLLGGEFATQMTCQEAGCQAWRYGWWVVIDPTGETGAWQGNWIKQESKRRFYEWPAAEALEGAMRLEAQRVLSVTPEVRAMLQGLSAGLIAFWFPPGQQCFREHLDREIVFKHDNYTHVKPLDFNEDFNEQADKVNTANQRG